jgi:microcystin-dependent protein
MSLTPYLSEIKIFAFNFAPQGWAQCNGQFLPINQNQALFSLLGTTYGGNGQTTFALPDLRGRVPMHRSNTHTLGEVGGQFAHTLSLAEMPAHTHFVNASGNAPNIGTPLNNFFASNTGFTPYEPTPDAVMAPQACTTVGGSQAHTNMAPYAVFVIGIALQGIFPSRN